MVSKIPTLQNNHLSCSHPAKLTDIFMTLNVIVTADEKI